MELDMQKKEALRLFRIWMEQEKLCSKYIVDEPLSGTTNLRDDWQNIVKDYENRKISQESFREFVKEYPESW